MPVASSKCTRTNAQVMSAFVLHTLLFTADLLHHHCFLIMQQSWGSHTRYCESTCLVEQPARQQQRPCVEMMLSNEDSTFIGTGSHLDWTRILHNMYCTRLYSQQHWGGASIQHVYICMNYIPNFALCRMTNVHILTHVWIVL